MCGAYLSKTKCDEHGKFTNKYEIMWVFFFQDEHHCHSCIFAANEIHKFSLSEVDLNTHLEEVFFPFE